MAFEAKNYDHLLGIEGFSDQLLKNHFTLYQGYVTNTNKLLDAMMNLVKEGKTGNPEFAEFKRRFGWEFNGMRLHDLYFSNMTKSTHAPNANSPLAKLITTQFGSWDKWVEGFKATGSMRGIGWVVLYYDTWTKTLVNAWINEHDVGHLTACVPLLIMDVFEHAFMLDYGLKRADYIAAFWKSIDWKEVEGRFSAFYQP